MSLTGNAESKYTIRGNISALDKIHGYSAYEIAVIHGYEGTEEEWLASLHGKDGYGAIINDLTTGGTSAALSAEMGKVLNSRPNPNLLHNWYFANPVNQRGQTEYTDGLYTIDRWGHNGGTVQIGGGLSWSQAYVLFQPFEYSLNDGKRRIFSYLDSAGNLASGELTTEYSLIGEVMVCHANTNHLYLLSTRSDLKIVAVKLELGDTQTLAHWDGSKWVLNEIPDYGEELLKCCMSKADSGDGYSNKTILHTGNKPYGSYTGNGSTMEVSIGGIGNALLLTNSVNGRSMIVMYAGAIGISGGNVIGYNWSAAQYVNGTLKLNSAEVDLNASGVTYKYEVL